MNDSDGSTTESENFDDADALSDVEASERRDETFLVAVAGPVHASAGHVKSDPVAATAPPPVVPTRPRRVPLLFPSRSLTAAATQSLGSANAGGEQPPRPSISRKRVRGDDISGADTSAPPSRRQALAQEIASVAHEPTYDEDEEPIELPLLSDDDDDERGAPQAKALEPAPSLGYRLDPRCPRCRAPVLHRDASDVMPRECWAQCICCRIAMIRSAFPSSEWATSAPRCVYCSRFKHRVERPYRSVLPWRQSRDDFRRAAAVATELVRRFQAAHAPSPVELVEHPMLVATQSQLELLTQSVDTLKESDGRWLSARADVPSSIRFELEEEQGRLERVETKLRQLLVLVSVQLLERHGATDLPADIQTVLQRSSKKAQRAIVHRAAEVSRHRLQVVLSAAARTWLGKVNGGDAKSDKPIESSADADLHVDARDVSVKVETPAPVGVIQPTPQGPIIGRGPRRVPLLFSRPSTAPVGAPVAVRTERVVSIPPVGARQVRPLLPNRPQSLPQPSKKVAQARIEPKTRPQPPSSSAKARQPVRPQPQSSSEPPTRKTETPAAGRDSQDQAKPEASEARRCFTCSGLLLHRDADGIVPDSFLKRCSCCRSRFTFSVFTKPHWRNKDDEARVCSYCMPERRQTEPTIVPWRQRLEDVRATSKAATNAINGLDASIAAKNKEATNHLLEAHKAILKRVSDIGTLRFLLKNCIAAIAGDATMSPIEFELQEEFDQLGRFEIDERVKLVVVLGEVLAANGAAVPSDVQALVASKSAKQRRRIVENATNERLGIQFRLTQPALAMTRKIEKTRKKEARQQATTTKKKKKKKKGGDGPAGATP
ncbi:hypothetical protein P43SY_000736 [Pythium insidiosum]|uniref:Uncharacterized protein n=1 Tax=Pythium insidiosum TaxID=114742 RepID=A0AAD5MAN6_PYTIN|nr:hypothetical protein P43SY_000736 [Pythium insidiosum]